MRGQPGWQEIDGGVSRAQHHRRYDAEGTGAVRSSGKDDMPGERKPRPRCHRGPSLSHSLNSSCGSRPRTPMA
jgi:hypothetical protein